MLTSLKGSSENIEFDETCHIEKSNIKEGPYISRISTEHPYEYDFISRAPFYRTSCELSEIRIYVKHFQNGMEKMSLILDQFSIDVNIVPQYEYSDEDPMDNLSKNRHLMIKIDQGDDHRFVQVSAFHSVTRLYFSKSISQDHKRVLPILQYLDHGL